MSNALIALNGSTELSDVERAIMAEVGDDTDAYDYQATRIKFPSGGARSFSVGDDDDLKPPFNGIIAVSQKARAFWPSKDSLGQPPLCSSPDGRLGFYDPDSELVTDAAAYHIRHPALQEMDEAKVRGPYQCARCPLAQWGSGNGRGQACKTLRRMIVLVEGWNVPAIMTVPPTSVKVFDNYASARARERGSAYFTVQTKFELESATSVESGVKYSVLKLSVSRPLDEAEIAAVIEIRHQYSDLVREMGITEDDYAVDVTASDGMAQEDAEDMPF